MLLDHDDGDADHGHVPENVCPFCKYTLFSARRRYHRFPLAIHRPLTFDFGEIVTLDPMERAYETLDTCGAEECKAQGDAFARQHNTSPGKKQYHAFNRWNVLRYEPGSDMLCPAGGFKDYDVMEVERVARR